MCSKKFSGSCCGRRHGRCRGRRHRRSYRRRFPATTAAARDEQGRNRDKQEKASQELFHGTTSKPFLCGIFHISFSREPHCRWLSFCVTSLPRVSSWPK